ARRLRINYGPAPDSLVPGNPRLPGPGWKWSGSRFPAFSDSRTSAGARIATFERAPLVFAHTAPYTGVLPGTQSPGQAFGGNGAAGADQLGIGNLRERRTTVAHREKQLRVLIATDGLMAPVHSFCSF